MPSVFWRILAFWEIKLTSSENSSESQSSGNVTSGQGTLDGQWEYLGGDAAHTRYSPANQINAENFEDVDIFKGKFKNKEEGFQNILKNNKNNKNNNNKNNNNKNNNNKNNNNKKKK